MIRKVAETVNEIEFLYFQERFEEKAKTEIESNSSENSSEKSEGSINKKKRKYLFFKFFELNRLILDAYLVKIISVSKKKSRLNTFYIK